MRSIGELLAELGFNPDSSIDVQKAFFKHLVKSAEENAPIKPVVAAPISNKQVVKAEPQQLEFNFGGSTPPKKVS